MRLDEQPNRLLSEKDSVDLLRQLGASGGRAVIEVSEWLLRATQAVDHLWADRRRNAVTGIGQARLLAVALHLRDDFTVEEKDVAFQNWEKVTFRIYGMFGKDARSKVGDYVRLAWKIIGEKSPLADVIKDIRALGADFPIEKAVQEIRDTNCYEGWQTELRYFMCRYEESLANNAGQQFNNAQWDRIWEANAADSIEHVYPQSKGAGAKTDTGIFVHRLGNLVLLPPRLNSKLKDAEPLDKKVDYEKTGLLIAQDVAARIPIWDRAAVEQREKELLEWAKVEWAD
jgi:hypothetical protein